MNSHTTTRRSLLGAAALAPALAVAPAQASTRRHQPVSNNGVPQVDTQLLSTDPVFGFPFAILTHGPYSADVWIRRIGVTVIPGTNGPAAPPGPYFVNLFLLPPGVTVANIPSNRGFDPYFIDMAPLTNAEEATALNTPWKAVFAPQFLYFVPRYWTPIVYVHPNGAAGGGANALLPQATTSRLEYEYA